MPYEGVVLRFAQGGVSSPKMTQWRGPYSPCHLAASSHSCERRPPKNPISPQALTHLNQPLCVLRGSPLSLRKNLDLPCPLNSSQSLHFLRSLFLPGPELLTHCVTRPARNEGQRRPYWLSASRADTIDASCCLFVIFNAPWRFVLFAGGFASV